MVGEPQESVDSQAVFDSNTSFPNVIGSGEVGLPSRKPLKKVWARALTFDRSGGTISYAAAQSGGFLSKSAYGQRPQLERSGRISSFGSANPAAGPSGAGGAIVDTGNVVWVGTGSGGGMFGSGTSFFPRFQAGGGPAGGGGPGGGGDGGTGGGDGGSGDDNDDDSNDSGGLRFNDVVGDQSGINGHDDGPRLVREGAAAGFKTYPGDEQLVDFAYRYNGVDGDGADVFGFGYIDVEIPDEHPGGYDWLDGYEAFTFESREGNADAFRGEEFDANGLEVDLESFGQHFNFGVLNGTGNLRWDDDSKGGLANFSLIDGNYQNGDPNPERDDDITLDLGASLGLGLGFNVITDDPDGDGHANEGFVASVGPVTLGVTAENAEDAAEASAGWVVERGNDLQTIANGASALWGGW